MALVCAGLFHFERTGDGDCGKCRAHHWNWLYFSNKKKCSLMNTSFNLMPLFNGLVSPFVFPLETRLLSAAWSSAVHFCSIRIFCYHTSVCFGHNVLGFLNVLLDPSPAIHSFDLYPVAAGRVFWPLYFIGIYVCFRCHWSVSWNSTEARFPNPGIPDLCRHGYHNKHELKLL